MAGSSNTLDTAKAISYVVNALLSLMASGPAAGFRIDGFGTVLPGAVLIGIVNGLLILSVNERGAVPFERHTGRCR